MGRRDGPAVLALRALPQLRLGPVPVLLVGPAFSGLGDVVGAFGDHLLGDLRRRGLLRRHLWVVGSFVSTASVSGGAAFFDVALRVVGFSVTTASVSGGAAFFDVAFRVVDFF